MTKLTNVLIVPMVAVLVAGGLKVVAQDQTPAPAQERKPDEKKLKKGEADAKRMLLLMDQDKNGKVSKQEFMSFMDADFERMDKNKDGELDVKELTQLRFVHHSGIRR